MRYGTRNDWLSRATCDGLVAGAALLVGAPGSHRFSGNNACTRYTLPPPITKVSPAKLPGALRGIHYTLPGESYAIHYQEDQWEGSSEYTLLHEAYEIVHETLWKRGHDQPPDRKVCPEADRFAAAVLMPADIFDAYALASGLDVVALHGVFRCSYAAAAIRLGEVMDRQPLFVALYERDEAGDPADWPEGNEPHSLRAKVVKRTAGFIPPASAPALRLPGRDSPSV